jgi:IS605 OrfB family transposase
VKRKKNKKPIVIPYDLESNYPDFAKKLYSFMKFFVGDSKPELITELQQKLFINPLIPISNNLKNLCRILEKKKYLYHFLKKNKSFCNLNCFYSQLSIQTLKYVESAWKSYRKGIKAWREHPELFTGKPNIPRVRKINTQFLISFSGHFLNNEKYAKGIVEHYKRTLRTKKKFNKKGKLIRCVTTGELRLPPKFLKSFPENDPFPVIRTKIPIEKIIEVRIVPKKSSYDFEIIYPKPIKITSNLNPKRALSIDIGVNILASLTTNFGTRPELLLNNSVKSLNQYFNKRVKYLQSIRFRLDDDLRKRMKNDKTIKIRDLNPAEIKKILKGYLLHERKRLNFYEREKLRYLNTIKMLIKTNKLENAKKLVVSYIEKEISRFSAYRTRFIRDAFHKISSYIIGYCLKYHIGKIAIGYNVFRKQKAKLRRKTSQKFQYIPFYLLLRMIKYKAKLVGIEFKSVSEHHTSKCSALDFESIEHHDKYKGRRKPSIKGRKSRKELSKGGSKFKRVYPRGLFRSAKGYIIHSDVNGSFNIGRVAYPNLFNLKTLTVENMLLNPVSVEIEI